jgi:hypothetical protein
LVFLCFKMLFQVRCLHSKLINPFTPNDLQRRRAVSPLKIKIPSQNLSRQRCAEGFNSGVKWLRIISLIYFWTAWPSEDGTDMSLRNVVTSNQSRLCKIENSEHAEIMKFSRADSSVRMWMFPDVSGTNSVPIFRVCCWFGRTKTLDSFMKHLSVLVPPSTPWRWGRS